MADASFPLTGAQKNALHDAVDSPKRAPDFARTGEANPKVRVFAVHFDGTQNNREEVPKGYQKTLVAASHEELEASGNPAVMSKYYRGVGTGPRGLRRVVEAAFGVGCERNAERAHTDFVKQVAKWQNEDPDVEVHVHAVGFSRGSATALHFLNLVDQRGALHVRESADNVPPRLRAGQVKSSAVLYDTVSTGQGDNLLLTVPTSCVGALHLTAGGEERILFPLRHIAFNPDEEISYAKNAWMPGATVLPNGLIEYQRIQTVDIPGARHSDVGGSYEGGNIREASHYLAAAFQESLGLPVQPRKPSFEHIQNAQFHDSRMLKIGEDLEDMQKSERLIEQVQDVNWDGRYVHKTSIKGLAQVPQISIGHADVNDQEHPDPWGMWLGKDYKAKLTLRAASPGKPMELMLESADARVYTIENDRLMLLDKPVPGFPLISEVTHQLAQQREAGLKPKPINISVDLRRLGVICEGRSAPSARPTPCMEQPVDPWPAGLRESLRLVNASQTMTPEEAAVIVEMAQHAVSEAIHETASVEHVCFKPSLATQKMGSGMTQKNLFEVSCKTAEGELSTSLIGAGRAQSGTLGAMWEMRRGLNLLLDAVMEKGYKPPEGVDMTYLKGNPRPLSQAKASEMLERQKPIRVPMDTSRFMANVWGREGLGADAVKKGLALGQKARI